MYRDIMGLWRMFKEARQRNAALETYMDEIESRVRQRLQESGERATQQRIQAIFLEEIKHNQPIPGLSKSKYWDRTMLLTQIEPRIAALYADLQH